MSISRRKFIAGTAATAALFSVPGRSADAGELLAPNVDWGRFELHRPSRWCDTRAGQQGWIRLDEHTMRVPLAGGSEGVLALAVNVTVIGGPRSGFVTAYPAGAARPKGSLVNVRAGETRANAALLKVSPAGLDLYLSAACDVIVDVVGTFVRSGPTGSGRFEPTTPTRLVDTRDQAAPFRAGEDRTFVAPVPTDALVAVCNLTVVDSLGAGYWSAWAGGARPHVSNVNTDGSGQTRAGLAFVPLHNGRFNLFSAVGGHIAIDCVGYFTGGSAPVSDIGLYTAIEPQRLLDSRTNGARLVSGTEREVAINSDGGVAMLNVTMVEPVVAGYAAVRAAGSARRHVSNLNAQLGAVIPNSALTAVSERGVALYSDASSHYVVDLYGMFTGPRVAATHGLAGVVQFGLQQANLELACDEFFDVGMSATGLPLRVFRVGSGRRVALITSHLHGDEWTGESIIADIVQRGPIAGWTLLLAPSMNPDARARNSRFVGVDMNRDFEVGWSSIAPGTPSGCIVTGTGSQPYSLSESAAWRDAVSHGPLQRAELVMSHHDNYNWVAPQNGLPGVYRPLADDYALITGLRTSSHPKGNVPTNTSWTQVPGGFETFCFATGKPTILIENKAGYGGACHLGAFGHQPSPAAVSSHYDALRSLLGDARLPLR